MTLSGFLGDLDQLAGNIEIECKFCVETITRDLTYCSTVGVPFRRGGVNGEKNIKSL
jgi:hypothetical protein